ncbi:MAG TPA: class I SAM-dependent methyltransferase [Streptosporangiaceae bacterium]|nr:class I SAM-dependent methyltransferase [Streptosporangiaceae bacterium]
MQIEVDPAWHETNFGDNWLRVALNFPGPLAADEARFAAQVLGLRPGTRVLDMPCGHGRHSVELARLGVAVTGVDSSAASIRLAIEAAREGSLESLADFHVGDMRTFALDDPADAVIVMQTSFGFMATREEDLGILRNIRRSLVPGGKLLIDSVSPFRIARTMIVPRRWERLADGTIYAEEREYDFLAGRLAGRIELLTPEGERLTLAQSTRVYTLPELNAMMGAAGYRLTASYGGTDGSAYGFDSRRLIVVAERVEFPQPV